MEKVESGFTDNDQLLDFITEKLVRPAGRVLDESHPIVDLRFADGSRGHIIIPPVAANGPTVVLRKLPRILTADEIVSFGSVTWDMLNFIKACVEGHLNILVAGGTGSGKTTILNIIANFIPDSERIITINGWAQLALNQPHQVILETRAPDVNGEGEITQSHLMASAMKMRPDRIVLGEVVGGEMSLLLQALITGHDGSMFSIHAISPRDALARLEGMVTEGRPQLPLLAVRQQLASGLNLIVNQQRLADGGRRIMSITEISGFQDGIMTLEDIFRFEQTGIENGRISGAFKPTGYVPNCLHRLRSAGIDVPDSLFEPS
jgi:pilus assembly protein CpaF